MQGTVCDPFRKKLTAAEHNFLNWCGFAGSKSVLMPLSKLL
jgi:hypothetical protein